MLRRDAHVVLLAVDDAAAVAEDVERLVVLDEDAGVLEHLERREMDVVDLVGREDVEREAPAALPARVQTPFHRPFSFLPRAGPTAAARHFVCLRPGPAHQLAVRPARCLNLATLLIGTSSTSAMRNFASIAPAWDG